MVVIADGVPAHVITDDEEQVRLERKRRGEERGGGEIAAYVV